MNLVLKIMVYFFILYIIFKDKSFLNENLNLVDESVKSLKITSHNLSISSQILHDNNEQCSNVPISTLNTTLNSTNNDILSSSSSFKGFYIYLFLLFIRSNYIFSNCIFKTRILSEIFRYKSFF